MGRSRRAVPSVVYRQDERVIARGLDARRHPLNPLPIALDIHLEQLGPVPRLHRALKTRLRHGTHRLDSAECLSRFGARPSRLRVQSLHSAHRREHDRYAHLVAQEFGGWIHC